MTIPAQISGSGAWAMLHPGGTVSLDFHAADRSAHISTVYRPAKEPVGEHYVAAIKHADGRMHVFLDREQVMELRDALDAVLAESETRESVA